MTGRWPLSISPEPMGNWWLRAPHCWVCLTSAQSVSLDRHRLGLIRRGSFRNGLIHHVGQDADDERRGDRRGDVRPTRPDSWVAL